MLASKLFLAYEALAFVQKTSDSIPPRLSAASNSAMALSYCPASRYALPKKYFPPSKYCEISTSSFCNTCIAR